MLLLSFVPMFFIAAAFYYMNRVDTDCGTTFSWVTRAMGPYWGFMGGWAICTTGILVVGSLADVSAYYTYDLLGLDGGDGKPLYTNELAVAALAVAIIAVMTAICVIGTELSAHLQRVLTLGQVGILLLFAGVVFVRLIFGDVPRTARSIPSSAGCRRSGPITPRSSPASSCRCSSTGAGRARSTSPRRPRTPRARPGWPGSPAP